MAIIGKDKKPKSLLNGNKNIQKSIELLKNSIADIEKLTYFSDTDDTSYDATKSELEKSADNIRSIMANNSNNAIASASNASKLISRLNNTTTIDDDVFASLALFDDPLVQNGLLQIAANTIYIKQQDKEIDNIIHYMPRLLEALKIKRNYILSADHFGKDFLSFTDVVRGDKPADFQDNMKRLYKKFGLTEVINDLLLNMSKYGEQFAYVLPYKKAFKKLFNNRPMTMRAFREGAYVTEATDMLTKSKQRAILAETTGFIKNLDMNISELFSAEILESASCQEYDEDFMKESFERAKETYNTNSAYNFNVMIDDNMFIEQFVAEETISITTKENLKSNSLHESFMEDLKYGNVVVQEHSENVDIQSPDFLQSHPLSEANKMEVNQNLAINDIPDNTDNEKDVDIPGAIMKIIDRDKIIPCCIENTVIMYLYIEVIGPANSTSSDLYSMKNSATMTLTHTLSTSNNVVGRQGIDKAITVSERDAVLGYVSAHISKKITKKFVNLNQDLSKEIYMILKNNDLVNSPASPISGNIRITCIPPTDIIHFKYNTNPLTHRGVSDLAYSIYPATIWVWLMMSFAIGTLTRGQDKRIYYAKSQVDTNIAGMMLNTINQLKRGNYGVRQIENINNIFNILGRYTDLIMPLSANGEQPIQIDVLKGQDIDPHQEMLDKLEEYAVNMTEISIDFVSTHRQMDYAIQGTMTNNTTSQMVTNRQDIVSEQLGAFITLLYDYEYDTNIEIGVALPEPVFLKSNNNTQIIQAVVSEAQATASSIYPDEIVSKNEQKALEKAEFIKIYTKDKLKRHYSESYIDDLIQKAQLELSKDLNPKAQSEEYKYGVHNCVPHIILDRY